MKDLKMPNEEEISNTLNQIRTWQHAADRTMDRINNPDPEITNEYLQNLADLANFYYERLQEATNKLFRLYGE